MEFSKEKIIENLDLQPHPEGGYFKEVYRSRGEIASEALPDEFNTSRNFATSIYFLLTSDNFSSFHKINQDETWHFYLGSPICLHQIDPKGNYTKVTIGNNIFEGEQLQYTVPANCWFAAEVNGNNSFSLLGCGVAPGFDFDDFTLAKRGELIKLFSNHKGLITKFTRS